MPLPKSSAPPAACDAWRRRSCDLSGLAHSETAQAVRVRIPVRVAVAVMHQSLGNASDPITPPSGASAKLPPLTFHHAKIALVHVTESRVPMHQVLHDWGGRRSKSCTRATSNLVFKNEHACHNDRRGHGEVGSGASLRIPGGGRAIGMLTRTPRPLSDRARGLGWPSCECGNKTIDTSHVHPCCPRIRHKKVLHIL